MGKSNTTLLKGNSSASLPPRLLSASQDDGHEYLNHHSVLIYRREISNSMLPTQLCRLIHLFDVLSN